MSIYPYFMKRQCNSKLINSGTMFLLKTILWLWRVGYYAKQQLSNKYYDIDNNNRMFQVVHY